MKRRSARCEHGRVLASREEQDRIACLSDTVAQDVHGLALEPIEMARASRAARRHGVIEAVVHSPPLQ